MIGDAHSDSISALKVYTYKQSYRTFVFTGGWDSELKKWEWMAVSKDGKTLIVAGNLYDKSTATVVHEIDVESRTVSRELDAKSAIKGICYD